MINKLISSCILVLISFSSFAQDITVLTNEKTGPIKRMNATNNGPLRETNTQTRSNMEAFSALNIPYCRTHDSAFYYEIGGEHIVDITAIFPDFSKDAEDPASYDFLLTDLYLKSIKDAGSDIFFRLGQKIQHLEKKYGIYPPEDFQKWAEICEHIVRHYNCGWADGYRWNIRYWEIWNEADNDKERYKTNPECWGGSEEQFFDFYCTAARHLKKCHPDILVGGPAVAYDDEWGGRFLRYMTKHKAAVDFYTWHSYEVDPHLVENRIVKVRAMLDSLGYQSSEMIISEWNYVSGWGEKYMQSLKGISSLTGAAYTAAFMTMGQNMPVDMLMYYDMSPTSLFNGAFDLLTNEPVQGYYPFYAWNKLAKLGTQVRTICDNPDIYVTAATDNQGKTGLFVIRYLDRDTEDYPKNISVSVPGIQLGDVYGHLTDPHHIFTEVPVKVTKTESGSNLTFKLMPDSFIYIEY